MTQPGAAADRAAPRWLPTLPRQPVRNEKNIVRSRRQGLHRGKRIVDAGTSVRHQPAGTLDDPVDHFGIGGLPNAVCRALAQAGVLFVGAYAVIGGQHLLGHMLVERVLRPDLPVPPAMATIARKSRIFMKSSSPKLLSKNCSHRSIRTQVR